MIKQIPTNAAVRMRMALSVAVVGLLMMFITAVGVYERESQIAEERAGAFAESVAIRIADAINVPVFVNHAGGHQIDQEYIDIQQHIQTAASLVNAKYLYAMVPLNGDLNSKQWRYVYDSSDWDVVVTDDTDDISKWMPPAVLAVVKTGKPVHNALHTDPEYGTLVSGKAPIRDASGSVVGIVGCDLDGSYVEEAALNVWQDIGTAFAVSIAIMIVLLDTLVGRRCCGRGVVCVNAEEERARNTSQ